LTLIFQENHCDAWICLIFCSSGKGERNWLWPIEHGEVWITA